MTSQSAFTREEILQCSRGELFGPSNAHLPAPNMLMIDRITNISVEGGHYGKGQVFAEFDINPGQWFFDCHFIDDPVMPGCLGLDAMWQLIGFFLAWKGYPGHGRALGSGKVRFSGQVLPTAQKISYEINFKRVIERTLVLGIADGIMLVDGRNIYNAEDLRVGLFTSTKDF